MLAVSALLFEPGYLEFCKVGGIKSIGIDTTNTCLPAVCVGSVYTKSSNKPCAHTTVASIEHTVFTATLPFGGLTCRRALH